MNETLYENRVGRLTLGCEDAATTEYRERSSNQRRACEWCGERIPPETPRLIIQERAPENYVDAAFVCLQDIHTVLNTIDSHQPDSESPNTLAHSAFGIFEYVENVEKFGEHEPCLWCTESIYEADIGFYRLGGLQILFHARCSDDFITAVRDRLSKVYDQNADVLLPKLL